MISVQYMTCTIGPIVSNLQNRHPPQKKKKKKKKKKDKIKKYIKRTIITVQCRKAAVFQVIISITLKLALH